MAIATIISAHNLRIQTDITSLLNIEIDTGWPTKHITDKFSSVINVVVKSPNQIDALLTTKEIKDIVDSDSHLEIVTNNISPKVFIDLIKEHKNSFLGLQDREILKNGDFNKITDNATRRVNTSLAPTALPVSQDPFLLVTNYLSEIAMNNTGWVLQDGFLWQYRAPDNFYMLPIMVDVDGNDELVATVTDFNQKISGIKKSHDVQIYTGGAPIHTAQMYNKSKIEISILSVLALVAAVILNYLLFRRISTIIPIITALGIGYLVGTLCLFLFSQNPHILVFVFGTTLVSLGIDYLFHFMYGGESQNNVHKNILHSLLTTIVCFLPLMFSSIDLLRQISVFTISGLVAVYIFINLFLQKNIIEVKKTVHFVNPIKSKYRPYIVGIISVLVVIACSLGRIENNMSLIYRPSTELAETEKIISELNQSTKTTFLIIRGSDIQNLLENEERIRDKGVNFFSLSTIIPSQKRQIENQELVKQLYDSQAKNIQKKLGLRKKTKFSYTPELSLDMSNIQSQMKNLLFNSENYLYSVTFVPDGIVIDDTDAHIISVPGMIKDKLTEFSIEIYNLLIICGVVLLGLLLILYKRQAFMYLIPPLFGVGCAIGILSICGIPITFFHMLGLFIVVGLGLDYAIFHINTVAKSELRPVFYSFLTSFIGFGLLAFTSFSLIAAMGLTLAIGIAVSYLASLYLFRN